jgi:hypothetical protein
MKLQQAKKFNISKDCVKELGVLIHQKEQTINENRYFGEHAKFNVLGHTLNWV